MRPIDADWLVEVLNNRGYRIVSFYFGGIRKIFDTKEYIDKFPTINIEELRSKGKWNKDGTCSVCGVHGNNIGNEDYPIYAETDYCPHCGAKMEE